MAESKASDTVPNLGFKDKDKALETIKELEGRDPDYQKLAIKGLIGRANRVLSITKAEDKLTNIKEAINVFEDWLKNFEKLNLSKENMAYLPLSTVKIFAKLQKHFDIDNTKFIDDYEKKADGDYKKLRTVTSDEGEPTWDIVRNTNLKKLLKEINAQENVEYWDDDGLPTKIHTQLILWAYSPEAAKIKKSLTSLEEKIKKLVGSAPDDNGNKKDDESDDDENDEEDENGTTTQKNDTKKSQKRKSESGSDRESDESPKKKRRSESNSSDANDSK